ncbi:MAG TPA: VCBS domain-containing protein, partial [Candidatus Berkiella sp.]|nr:VCBS domain-containing protein [Candidatus Berkiella sp.]
TDIACNTFVVDQATGSYAYNLNNPFTNINNQPTVLVYTFTFTDADLDTVSKTITITINDDIPIALTQDAGSVNEADIPVV